MEQGNTCNCAFCNRKIKDGGMELWEMPAREYDKEKMEYKATKLKVSICESCNAVYEQAFRDNLVDLTAWNNFVSAKIKYQVESNTMRRVGIDELIEICDSECEAYEDESEHEKKPIGNLKDYLFYYSTAEWLRELREYKQAALPPEKVLELHEEYVKAAMELHELKIRNAYLEGKLTDLASEFVEKPETEPEAHTAAEPESEAHQAAEPEIAPVQKKTRTRPPRAEYLKEKYGIVEADLRRLYLDERMGTKEIAEKYKVSRQTIERILYKDFNIHRKEKP